VHQVTTRDIDCSWRRRRRVTEGKMGSPVLTDGLSIAATPYPTHMFSCTPQLSRRKGDRLGSGQPTWIIRTHGRNNLEGCVRRDSTASPEGGKLSCDDLLDRWDLGRFSRRMLGLTSSIVTLCNHRSSHMQQPMSVSTCPY